MGAHVLELARLTRDAEARHRRDDLRVPEVHAGAVLGGRPLERLPGGDERAVRRREEVGAGRRAVRTASSTGIDAILLLPGEPLRAARQLPPRRRARDSRPDPQDARGRRRDRALGRRLADPRVPLRRGLRRRPAARRRALRRRRAREPRHGRRDVDPRARRDDRRADRASTARSSGTRRCRTASRAGSSTSRARGSCSASRRGPSLRDGLERTIAWYRELAVAPSTRSRCALARWRRRSPSSRAVAATQTDRRSRSPSSSRSCSRRSPSAPTARIAGRIAGARFAVAAAPSTSLLPLARQPLHARRPTAAPSTRTSCRRSSALQHTRWFRARRRARGRRSRSRRACRAAGGVVALVVAVVAWQSVDDTGAARVRPPRVDLEPHAGQWLVARRHPRGAVRAPLWLGPALGGWLGLLRPAGAPTAATATRVFWTVARGGHARPSPC